ncbi:hypothetical protein CSB45_15580 [candidate division KSB3 bacterium]|uniref:Uncharacterized protein n=1 Tax=candidate division KSB3 bacterium TaxID=2044937 RepID=A0A2G6E091_9BACT|nr:MAG: hypothetical protein CSB45_15580 [candidate division KSB3 bacterium]
MRRMRRRPLKPLGTLLLMIFTLILAVLVYNSHLGAEEPATEPVAPANTLESANTSEPAEAPANPSAAQPDVNSFWQRQDNELYYYGQGKGNSDERFVFDRRGRLEAAYRDEHLIARYSYPSAYMVVQDIYQNEQKIEQRIYQKDSKGALIATLILKIDDER